jgi:hypothetical protein
VLLWPLFVVLVDGTLTSSRLVDLPGVAVDLAGGPDWLGDSARAVSDGQGSGLIDLLAIVVQNLVDISSPSNRYSGIP